MILGLTIEIHFKGNTGMPVSFEQIQKTKRRIEDDLMKRPGINGIDIGRKYIRGQKTEQLAIRILVKKKLPTIAPEQRIPKEIDGVPTDVIERTFRLAVQRLPKSKIQLFQQLEVLVDGNKYDPLIGGIGIGPCRELPNPEDPTDPLHDAGTLGLIVKDSSNNLVALSNYHVLCADSGWHTGDIMAQPSVVDGGNCPIDIAAQLITGISNEHLDCAIARVAGRNARTGYIQEIGIVSGIAQASEADPVKKRGRRTGLTHGIVDTIDLTTTAYSDDGSAQVLKNQIGINVDTSQDTWFGHSGDSGSVVVNSQNAIIGLYFAEADDGTYGMANKIDAVFSALNLHL